jgi:phenylacetate-CoA ligase
VGLDRLNAAGVRSSEVSRDPNPDWSVGGPPPTATLPRRLALTGSALRFAAREIGSRRRSARAFERHRDRRVRRIVAHAYRHVPFYRETMRRRGLGPGDIRTAGDLAKLPVIERGELQADPERFMDESRRRGECVEFRTGGSSGRPVTVVNDLRDLIEKNSAGWRIRSVLAELGVPRIRRRVARVEPPKSSGEKLAAAANGNNLLARVDPRLVELRLDAGIGVERLIEPLNAFAPDVIAAYGSIAEELFAHSVRTGEAVRPPKLVAYGADAMSEGARGLITGELGIPVVSTYQAVESPMIAFECTEGGGMHVNSDLCPLRIVEADGSEAAPGAEGDVLISNLVFRTTVLLNYRIGDLAAWAGAPCRCGRALPLLSLLRGRSGVFFTGPDGRRIASQLAERAFSSNREVLGYRLEQMQPATIVGSAIPAPGVETAALERRILERYATLVGEPPSLQVRFVDRLPRTPGGKVSRAEARSPVDPEPTGHGA